jgi:NADH:ubiquinone oxidoreductase subunit 4 (subunit M)
MFGNLKIDYTMKFRDTDEKEFQVLLPLFLFIFLFGLYPNLITEFIHFFSINLWVYMN